MHYLQEISEASMIGSYTERGTPCNVCVVNTNLKSGKRRLNRSKVSVPLAEEADVHWSELMTACYIAYPLFLLTF